MRRVLLVEDHEAWRRRISSALDQAPHWQVAGEASDGIDAVRKVEELRPDLTLMDVGLPGIDGLQAAQRILASDPDANILFVSEQQSWEIAQAALALGARGYIVKSDARRDLISAMDAIVAGKRIVSARFGGLGVDTTNDLSTTRKRHEGGFYADERSLLDDCARFAETALNAGTSVLVLVGESRRDGVVQRLRASGVDIDQATREKRYVWLDIPAMVSKLIVNGRLDEGRFWDAASAVIMEAANASTGTQPRVAACGECAPTLLRRGLVEAAVALERLWDDVTRTFDVDVLCLYSAGDLCCDVDNSVFQEICAAHSAVHLNGTRA